MPALRLLPPLALITLLAVASCGDSSGPGRLVAPPSGSSSGGSTPPISTAACGSLPYAWKGEAGNIFREATLSAGEWIYTNGLWQARGANADGLKRTDYYAPAPADDPGFMKRDLYLAMTYDFFGSHRGTHNGDYQLPMNTATWPDGTADLAELRLAATANALHVRFLWNAMPRPDAQIATLTFASAASTPAATAWPRNAKFSSGWQSALTLWGKGGALQQAGGAETPVAVAVGDHVTEACIPLAALPAAPWTLTGGAGLADPADTSRYWTVPAGFASATAPGSGAPTSPSNVWSLLFAADTPWSFDELSQSAQLSAATVGSAKATVALAPLQAGASEAAPLRTGAFSRLLVSRHFEADGIRRGAGALPGPPEGFAPPIPTPDFNVSYFYTGRLQPYAMNVPAAYATGSDAWPLIVYLHGFTGLPEEPFHNPVGLVQMAEQKGYLLASALGRGDYFYTGEGDLDVLEVLADVQKHYRVDPERIYLMGHSMGGFGTHNVATKHPDLFAAIAPAQGTDGMAVYRNLRNLPWFHMTSDQDLDAFAQDALAMYGLLSGEGFDATILEYRTKIHEYSSIYDTLPRLFDFFGRHRRQLNPAVVSYTREAGADRPDLGLVYDRAYWMSGLTPANAANDATITLESFAIAHAVPDATAATRSDAAVDEGGPTGRTMAQLKRTIPATGPMAAISNRLGLVASNAASARIELPRSQLTLAVPLTLNTESDAPLSLLLANSGSSSARVQVDGGAPMAASFSNGALVVPVPAGSHTLTVTAN